MSESEIKLKIFLVFVFVCAGVCMYFKYRYENKKKIEYAKKKAEENAARMQFTQHTKKRTVTDNEKKVLGYILAATLIACALIVVSRKCKQ